MQGKAIMTQHPLIHAIQNFKGNARVVVLTEPLWGIPYNLYFPFLSIYMLAVGLTDAQIGLLTSIGMAVQILGALLGGPITDKLGRRLTILIFDLISWSAPCILWAFSKDFSLFVLAAVFNGFWRLSMIAFPLLLAEDTDPKLLVDIYSWIYIFVVSVALFTPITGILIDRMDIIPAMRLVLLVSAGIMTSKVFLLFFFSKETQQGILRREQTRGQSIFSLLGGYQDVFKGILKQPGTLFTLAVIVINTICNMITNTFWSILVTQQLGISPQWMSVYPFARALFVLFFFFVIMPQIRRLPFRVPMLAGYAGFVLSQLILVVLPVQSYVLLMVSVFLEACSYASLNPQFDRLLIVAVDERDRARILSIIWVIALLISTPFGWIVGELSSLNRVYPFILNMVLFAAGGLLTYRFTKRMPDAVQE